MGRFAGSIEYQSGICSVPLAALVVRYLCTLSPNVSTAEVRDTTPPPRNMGQAPFPTLKQLQEVDSSSLQSRAVDWDAHQR